MAKRAAQLPDSHLPPASRAGSPLSGLDLVEGAPIVVLDPWGSKAHGHVEVAAPHLDVVWMRDSTTGERRLLTLGEVLPDHAEVGS